MGVSWREWSETRTELERGRVGEIQGPNRGSAEGSGRGPDGGQCFNRRFCGRLCGRGGGEGLRFSGRRATGKADLHMFQRKFPRGVSHANGAAAVVTNAGVRLRHPLSRISIRAPAIDTTPWGGEALDSWRWVVSRRWLK